MRYTLSGQGRIHVICFAWTILLYNNLRNEFPCINNYIITSFVNQNFTRYPTMRQRATGSCFCGYVDVYSTIYPWVSCNTSEVLLVSIFDILAWCGQTSKYCWNTFERAQWFLKKPNLELQGPDIVWNIITLHVPYV